MCLGAIYWARADRLYFACTRQDAACHGFDDETIYRDLALQPTQRSIPGEMLLREEGLAAFRAWGQNPQKIRY
jgi:tRNA(Arg) A34 adenosine deaminase TadA